MKLLPYYRFLTVCLIFLTRLFFPVKSGSLNIAEKLLKVTTNKQQPYQLCTFILLILMTLQMEFLQHFFRNFWDVLLNFPSDLQKKCLLFTTGSDRIPIGGMSEMQFKISRVGGTDL
jgi:hypothetical protein